MQNRTLNDLIIDYKHYKGAPLGEQVLRVSNTFFACFTFWNLVFRPDLAKVSPLSETASPALLSVALILGLILGALVLIKLSRIEHWLVLPILAAGFSVSSHRNTILGLVFVPCSALVLLLMIRLVITLANYFNRS